MDLKENWRAWQRSLEGVVSRVSELMGGNVREISGGFFVFGLFFCEEACECYDVSVDLLVLDGAAVCCHDDDGKVAEMR